MALISRHMRCTVVKSRLCSSDLAWNSRRDVIMGSFQFHLPATWQPCLAYAFMTTCKMNRGRYETKLSSRILSKSYYLGICLEALRNITGRPAYSISWSRFEPFLQPECLAAQELMPYDFCNFHKA